MSLIRHLVFPNISKMEITVASSTASQELSESGLRQFVSARGVKSLFCLVIVQTPKGELRLTRKHDHWQVEGTHIPASIYQYFLSGECPSTNAPFITKLVVSTPTDLKKFREWTLNCA